FWHLTLRCVVTSGYEFRLYFFFTYVASFDSYSLSLHDALPLPGEPTHITDVVGCPPTPDSVRTRSIFDDGAGSSIHVRPVPISAPNRRLLFGLRCVWPVARDVRRTPRRYRMLARLRTDIDAMLRPDRRR